MNVASMYTHTYICTFTCMQHLCNCLSPRFVRHRQICLHTFFCYCCCFAYLFVRATIVVALVAFMNWKWMRVFAAVDLAKSKSINQIFIVRQRNQTQRVSGAHMYVCMYVTWHEGWKSPQIAHMRVFVDSKWSGKAPVHAQLIILHIWQTCNAHLCNSAVAAASSQRQPAFAAISCMQQCINRKMQILICYELSASSRIAFVTTTTTTIRAH